MGHAPQSAANDASVAATFRVVAGRNDEFGRDVGTDAELGEQRRCGEMDELAEVAREAVGHEGHHLIAQVQSALFGGTAPFVATWLISITGSKLAPAWYLVAAAGVSRLPATRLERPLRPPSA